VAVADTQTVARLLREYAQRTALRGGNPIRAKAYSRPADSLSVLVVHLHVLIEENRRNSRSGRS
jgi:DNA polymerase (family X)